MVRMSGGRHVQPTLQLTDGQTRVARTHQKADQPKPGGRPKRGQTVSRSLFGDVVGGKLCLHTNLHN